jgi:serine/threonine protein kinase
VLEVGQVVGGYKVERSVGAGSMGEVYRVRHVERGTLHAMKYLPLPARKIRQRLMREAQLQTRLSHPNVVTLTEVIEVDGDPALVMELVEGPSLAVWLETNKPSLPEAEAIFRGIIAGVAHAHRRGLVHRDLKPGNVLLARTNTGLVPKVADFGIAKVLDASAPITSPTGGITRTGMSLGSPAYMAPEQIRDARLVDQAADMWSLGCILYELVCGARAFAGPDVLAVMNAVQAAAYRPPRDLRDDLPERFVKTIEGCLRTDREERFENADEVLEALDEGSPVTLPGAHARSATPPAARRRSTANGDDVDADGLDPRLARFAIAGAITAAVVAVVLIAVWLI